MAADSLRLATAHLRAGRLTEAIGVLRRSGPPSDPSGLSLYRVLLAEALERAGSAEEALGLVRAVLAERRRDPALHARCHVVLGVLASRQNAQTEAFSHFQRAIRLASQAKDDELLVRAQLRLLANLGDRMSPNALHALVNAIRKGVAGARDPELLATLHLEVARIEAGRGRFRLAKRHLQEAVTLTAGLSNVWFKGRLSLQASGVAFLSSELIDCVRNAQEALCCAEATGDQQLRAAATLNMAAARLALGDLQEAEAKLAEALSLTSGTINPRVGALLNLAILRLLQGRASESKSLLEETERLQGGLPSWWGPWTEEARIWLLRELGHWHAIRAYASHAIASTGDAHQCAKPSLLLLDAEAALELGERRPAALLVSELDRSELPLSSRAELERVRGKAFGIEGDLERAGKYLAKASRLSALAGDFAAFRRTVIDLSRCLRAPLSEEQIRSTWTSMREKLWVGAAGGARADDLGVGTGMRRPSSVDPTEIALLYHLATWPVAFAIEAFELIARSGAVEMAVLFATKPGVSTQVVATHGCPAEEARSSLHDLFGQERLFLSEADGWHFELGAIAKPTLAAGCVFAALWHLIGSCVDYHRLRDKERQRDALWPSEVGGDAEVGIRIADTTREIWAIARKIADTNLPVLITGETGTGKEVLARAIHQFSRRAAKPFLPFNCKAVPRDLLDSQLFGYRRGAFTGAFETFPGMVRAASGGTLFLDEIGDLDRDLQPKLLRFLETDEVLPLGETHPIRADTRIIAATNADLGRAVSEGRFREDLYYRLNVIHFHLPPLRERREEIPPLIHYFLRRHGEPAGKGKLQISDEALEYLLLYHWPGNVRQLENEVRRFVALAEPEGVITPESLSPTLRAARRTMPAPQADMGEPPCLQLRLDQPLPAAVRQLEVAMIAHALRATQGKIEQAAQLLGLSRKGLLLKRRRLGFTSTDAA